MNILYTNFHYGNGGGHSTYIMALLHNNEHKCYVACPASSRLYKLLNEQGFERLIDLSFPSKLSQLGETLRNTFRLKKIIEDNAIDIVHTNGSGDNRMALYASLICKRKFKVVYTKHNTIKVKGLISRLRLNRFNDAVILVSQSVLQVAGLAMRPNYHIVEHGVDVDYWRKSKEVQSGSKIRLVSNAGTTRNKGWLHLVEAIDMLPAEDQKRLSVVIMGRADTFLMERIEDIQRRMDFRHPGYLDDPRPELEEGDVGFVLSYREAMSFAAREMMSMSLPVISSDYPASSRNISPESGWITRTGDASSILSVLRSILDMPPEKLTQMKLAARARAKKNFSLEKMIAGTNAVYAQLVER